MAGAGSRSLTQPLGTIRDLLRQRPFIPHRWVKSGHLQTLVGSQQRRKFDWGWTASRTVDTTLEDGSRIEAEWVEIDPSRPTLVLVHGMSGSSRSAYMLGMSHKIYRKGWNSLLLNLYDRRNGGGVPKIFHAGRSADLWKTVRMFQESLGFKSAALVGVSLGGNLVLKLLGELGSAAPDWLLGGAVISPLVDLTRSWPLMEQPSNWIYQRYYVRRLKKLMQAAPGIENAPIDLGRLVSLKTVRQFDEVVTAPLGGYADAFDYYRAAGAAPLLPRITLPTLILHALDDPFLPSAPLEPARENPSIHLELTRHGGHVAYIEDRCHPPDFDRSWAENRVIDFIALLGTRPR